MLKERFMLASERIREIPEEKGMTAPPFEGFFRALASTVLAALEGGLPGELGPGAYEKSYACPSFACEKLGEDLGRPLSVLYYEVCSMALPSLPGDPEEILIRMELFLEVYQAFVIEFRETGGVPEGRYITGKIGQYLSDYFREEALRRLKALTIPSSAEEGKADRTLESMEDSMEMSMAVSMAEGFEKSLASRGFEGDSPVCGLGGLKGSERLTALSAAALGQKGIRAIPFTGRCSLFDLREDLRLRSCPGVSPRFFTDHREDTGLFLDESLRTRILQALEAALSEEGEALASFAGWAFFEEEGKDPKAGKEALRPDPMAVRLGRHQKKLLNGIHERAGEMIREEGLFLTEDDVFRLPVGRG